MMKFGKKSQRKQDEETTYWLSYSDMMAGLLLTFVLIIALTLLNSKIQYDQKQDELMGKEQELVIRSEELENERLLVDEQGAKLNAQELKLSEQAGKLREQEGQLASQRGQLEEQESKLKIQMAQLEEQSIKLSEQEALLDELEAIMYSQQEQLDKIIGIRMELIEALKAEFDNSELQISVDEKTGAITMDSTILYELNKDELKDTGKDFLGAFLPRYIHILLSPDYSPYVSEIVIEGHTDTLGTYLFNLDLSMKRAYSVAEYCLDEENSFLQENERKVLQQLLSATGKSYSNPIYNADGTVNADASRRVEILFRLKDEEMIREMIEILNSSEDPNTAFIGPGV